MRLLAFDPSVNHMAIAMFEDGRLWHCALLNSGSLEVLLRDLRDLRAVGVVGPADEAVVEIPQVYGAGKAKGDPNDLVRVACAAGGAACAAGGVVRLVRPREWKGTVPKGVHNKRTLGKLSDTERLVYLSCTNDIAAGLRHNVVDAIGLGLWRLGR